MVEQAYLKLATLLLILGSWPLPYSKPANAHRDAQL